MDDVILAIRWAADLMSVTMFSGFIYYFIARAVLSHGKKKPPV